jgi:hypothetical protein
MAFSPHDLALAAAGPARVLIAPVSAAVPTDPYSVISPTGVVVDGERRYPIVTAAATAGWKEVGLTKDAVSYGHSHEDGDAPEYEQTGELASRPESVSRALTVTFAEFKDWVIALIENTTDIETVAPTTTGAAAAKPGFKRIHTGTYDSLINYRAIFVMSYLAAGGATVTEPGSVTRPPWLWRVIPRVTITSDDKEIEAAKDGAAFECEFLAANEPTLSGARQHGYWIQETPGAFA